MDSPLIASRILTRADGTETAVSLYAPEIDGEDWFCRIDMGDFGEQKIYGIDSMQALALAMTALLANLRSIEENCAGQYTFLGSPSLSENLFIAQNPPNPE